MITETTIDEKLNKVAITDEDLIKQIETEYKHALDYRKPVIKEWHENEKIMYGEKPATLSGRSNIDLKLAHGFVDTFLSKIKSSPKVTFKPTKPSAIKKAKKVTALWEQESSPTREDWEFKDLLAKKLAMPSGRSISKVWASTPYKHNRKGVDHYDFLIDPLAGGYNINKARYLGEDNIFRSKYELENNEKYDKEAVQRLIASYSENQGVTYDNEYQEKRNRFAVVGLDINDFTPQKDGIFKLLEWFTTIDGQRWNVVCSLDKRIILYKTLLKEIVSVHGDDKQPKWPFTSWAYFPDEFNFWSIAPLTVMRENFQTRNVVMNGAIDNNEAKNRPMKSYDPKTYTNPALLKQMPDRLIPVKSGEDPTKGIFIHPVNNIYDPIKLDEKLEDVGSKVSGITPGTQGTADANQKVGIYYGDMQEVASRMGLFEMSYTRDNILKAQLYINGLMDRLDEPMAIKIIGEDGAEWDEIKQEDLDEDFDISIEGGTVSAQLDAIKQKQKADFIARWIISPTPVFNMKALAEQDAIIAGFSPLEAKRLLDNDSIDENMLSQASTDLEKLMSGIQVTPYRKANTAYLQKIVDFYSETNLEPGQDEILRNYMDSLQDIVIQNTVMKAQKELAAKGALPAPEMPGMTPGAPGMPEAIPNTPGGTISMASMQTNQLKPNYVNSQPAI
jgi:hypothetical protein